MPKMIRMVLAQLLLAACLAVPGSGPAVAQTAGSRAALSPGEHRVTLRGVRLWYRIAGRPGSGPPVLYLAGGPGGNSYTFAHIAGAPLERRQLMVYFDQRGTGNSERPASGDYAIATLVDDIEALRVHLGVRRLSIIAHSFGAVLALEYGARYPDRVAALVLAGALWNAPRSCREQAERIAEHHADAHRAMLAAGTPADDEICDRVFRALRGDARERFNEENIFPNRASLERLNATEAASGLRNTGELSRAVFRAGLLQYRFAGAARVRAPVLVVGGGRDYAAGPRTQRALAAALPRGRFLEYPALGHWMFIDDPQRFGRDVSRFLQANARR